MYDTFPKENEVEWIKYNNPLERKLTYNNIQELGPTFSDIFDELNGEEFLEFLKVLTGFKDIMADCELVGGGLHQTMRGGKLDIHADFNIHYGTKNLRCVNMIIFLNKEWKEEYGGHLELWDRKMKKCKQRILPTFNRAVIFSTDESSFHGHPDPLQCPHGWTRKSLALYYYIENNENSNGRSTKYMKRPLDPEDKKLDEFRKQRMIPKDKRKEYSDTEPPQEGDGE